MGISEHGLCLGHLLPSKQQMEGVYREENERKRRKGEGAPDRNVGN